MTLSTKNILFGVILLFSPIMITAQNKLQERIQRVKLNPNESISYVPEDKSLDFVASVEPAVLMNEDSLKNHSMNMSVDLVNDVIQEDTALANKVRCIYTNRYWSYTSQRIFFILYLPNGPLELSNVYKPDSIENASIYSRARRYSLANNEFLRWIPERTLGMTSYVCIDSIKNNVDSLKKVTDKAALRLLLDVIMDGCHDVDRVSVTFQDRHDQNRVIGWAYNIRDCYLDPRTVYLNTETVEKRKSASQPPPWKPYRKMKEKNVN